MCVDTFVVSSCLTHDNSAGTDVQFRDDSKRNSKTELSNVPAALGSQDAGIGSPDTEMVDLTQEEDQNDTQQSAETNTHELCTPLRNEGITSSALGRGEPQGNESADESYEVSIFAPLAQCVLC